MRLRARATQVSVLVQECVRYFELPICDEPHVHRTHCWDPDYVGMLNGMRDALKENEVLRKANELLKKENVNLKGTISVMRGEKTESGSGVRGQRADNVVFDELAKWARGTSSSRIYESVLDAMKAYDKKPTPVQDRSKVVVRQVQTPNGDTMWRTSDGKLFTHKSQAMRHAELLAKRP